MSWSAADLDNDIDHRLGLAEVRRIVKEQRWPLSVRVYSWWCFEFTSREMSEPVRFDMSGYALCDFERRLKHELPKFLPETVLYAARPRPRIGAGTHGRRR